MEISGYKISNDLFYLGIKALIKNNQNQILILRDNRQSSSGINTKGFWDLPGGRVQNRTSNEETLLREIYEELGIKDAKVGKLLFSANANFYKDLEDGISLGLVVMVYECKIPENAKIILSEEHDQYKWVDNLEASELLSIKYSKDLTDKIKQI